MSKSRKPKYRILQHYNVENLRSKVGKKGFSIFNFKQRDIENQYLILSNTAFLKSTI